MLARDASGTLRTLSPRVLHGRLPLEQCSQAHNDHWSGLLGRAGMTNAGDVRLLSHGWSCFRQATPAHLEVLMRRWLLSQGIAMRCLRDTEPALLASLGAWFHHDVQIFEDKAFCVVWLGDGLPWDLVFPQLDVRVPLEYGSVILFDNAQVHGVVKRGKNVFDPEDFENEDMCTGCFVSYSMSLLDPDVARVMDSRAIAPDHESVSDFHLIGPGKGFRDFVDGRTGAWMGTRAALPGHERTSA